ncbi:MAG TPA: hypothetical protein VLN49_07385 [Gemmatimonadaceae bacterium]|nr:hypothetical protein [Gemmatimonadaceae bacterium]
MDNAVALVQTYLRLNGYFTVTEYPVIVTKRDGAYRTATDLDVLAVRFPNAGRLVPGTRVGRDADIVALDVALATTPDVPDMLIGEVKEGRAELNEAASDPDVVRAVLAEFGCCSRQEAPAIAETLSRQGHGTLPNGHHARTVIFAGIDGRVGSPHLVITLGHVVEFLRRYLNDNWELLRHSDSKDPAFGFLMTLAKAERGVRS